jgi:hypothetical protein
MDGQDKQDWGTLGRWFGLGEALVVESGVAEVDERANVDAGDPEIVALL